MKPINIYFKLAYLLSLMLCIVFISCEKEKGIIKPSAQNVYSFSVVKNQNYNWILTNEEISFYYENFKILPNNNVSIINLNRVGFNSITGQFSTSLSNSENKLDSFDFINNVKIIQLNESKFLKINKVLYQIDTPYFNSKTNLFITDKNLNVQNKLTWDSSETILTAGMLPDERIIIVSQKGVSTNVTCLKTDYSIDWKKTIGNINVIGNEINDLVITNESIFLQTNDLFSRNDINHLIKLNFSGMNQISRQIKDQGKYEFNNMEESENGMVLSGQKYNPFTGLIDLCFLTYDNNLAIANETIINITDYFPDWDINNNTSYWIISKYFTPLVKDETGYWIAATYPNKKNTYSIKLIKFNKQMQLEKIIPIITNMDDNYTSTQLKMDANHIYITYANVQKGIYFFLLNKSGDLIEN